MKCHCLYYFVTAVKYHDAEKGTQLAKDERRDWSLAGLQQRKKAEGSIIANKEKVLPGLCCSMENST